MAAGISRERETRLRREILKRLVVELWRAQVPAVYIKATPGKHAVVRSAGAIEFRIWLETQRASNGEGCIVSHLGLGSGPQREHFCWLDFERGLEKLKARYRALEGSEKPSFEGIAPLGHEE